MTVIHSHRFIAGITLGLLLAACDRGVQASQPPAPAGAAVTVATPIAANVIEFSEHTGRAEAPESVEIRPRVSGPIVRAEFKEGDIVKKGQLLFVIDPRPFEVARSRAKADLATVRADYELAKKNAARADALLKDRAITQRDWDAQQAAQTQLGAREASALAAIEAADLDLEYAHIRSPIAGRVGRKLVTVGNLVSPQLPSPLTTVVSTDPLYVYVDVEEARGLNIARGKDVIANVGFAGEEGYPRVAHIDFLDNHVEAATGTLKVRATVPNHDGRLSAGLFARVRIPLGKAVSGLLISDRAVATDQDRRFVWIVDAESKVQYRAITLGPLEEGLRVITAGLTPTDRVIVRGLQRVRPGNIVVASELPMRDAAKGDK
jgi:multidrug efflux system membrane fusion protein